MAITPYVRRRIGRHLLLAAASVVMVAIIYPNVPTDFILRRWNLATAYAALALLALSLVLGPWALLRGEPNPVSRDLRRDVGIWAGILAVVHTVIGFGIHFGGQFWYYFVYSPDEPHTQPVRFDATGLANWTGLASTLLLLILLAISNDVALRRLGTRRWKSLQRLNYLAFAAMALHAITYQLLGKRVLPVIAVFVGIVAVVVGTQLAGVLRVRSTLRNRES